MKSGLAGIVILGSLLVVGLSIPLYAPYDVVRNWSSRQVWLDQPKLAAPEWSQIFTGVREPKTMIVEPGDFRKIVARPTDFDYTFINTSQAFTWEYDRFPSEISLTVQADFPGQSPLIQLYWLRPDGQLLLLLEDAVGNESRNSPMVIHISSDLRVKEKIRDWLLMQPGVDPSLVPPRERIFPEAALFAQVDSEIVRGTAANLLRGDYLFYIKYTGFTRQDDLSARFIIYGTVFGIAGTDDQRRDLLTGLMWGAPVALMFGTAAALVIVLIQTLLGALSAWFGGPIDVFVQRASDFFLVIPVLPILIIIALVARLDIVALLLVLIAFGIVGQTTKVVRSIVLQVREEQFIEAAESYGASRIRILFKYIVPRVLPYTFALVALSVPSFIFLEASLAFLGLGEQVLPTWGKLLGEAYANGALFHAYWWWIAIPAFGIVYTTIGFALLGYAFDKVLNPRLREE